MTSYLYEGRSGSFDYPKFAEPFRNELRENAERLAADNGIETELLRKRNVRKEEPGIALRPGLDERTGRLVAAAESQAIGKGGISSVSKATGVSRPVIR